MAPTSRSNQPTGPGGTSSGSGGTSDRGPGGASVEATHKPPTAGPVPPPPQQTSGGGGQRYQSPPQQPQAQQPKQVQYYLTEPLVVYDYTKKKKRNRKKYSRGLKTIQRTEDGLTLAGRRLGDAVESGFRSYRKRRNKSANRRKDGPLRDIVRNTAGGVSRFFSVGGDIPYDIARKVNNRRFGKQVRNTVQFFTAPFGLN
jgi:hypothetical protein